MLRTATAILALLSGALMTAPTPAGEGEQAAFAPPLFAFQTGFANADSNDPDYLAALVEQSGFDGVELMGLGQVPRFLPALRSRDLKLYSLYLKLDLDREQAYDDALPALLHNHGDQLHYLWFHVHSQRFGKSDPAGDKRCVELLRELAALAKPHGVKIGIYHHVGFWAERFRDAVRVARKVKRENVGAVFNLCHYLRTAGPETLESELRAAFPHLMLASINGADRGDTRNMKWDRLIQPLGDGSFDVGRVLTVLKQQQYRGPIGLQGYGISERPETFFPRSVAAYHRLLRQVNAPE